MSTRHARSSPLAIFLAVGIVANLLYQHTSHHEWLIYIIAAFTMLLARYMTFNVVFQRVALSVPAKVNIALVLSVLHGSVHGATLLFFPVLGEIERALLSLILAGFCLQATATGGDIRQYLCFSLPIMPTIALMWTTGGTFTVQSPEATLLGLSIAMFYIQQIYIALSNDRKAAESFEARAELARLNDELQTAVQQADVANRAKTRFLASASHDLRQPIQALSLFSAALNRQELPSQTRELAGHINDSVSVLSAQLDALLDLSKLDAGVVTPNIEPVDIKPMLQRIFREYQDEIDAKGLSSELNVEESFVTETDSLLFERIVRNLLNNAVRYTDRGSIRIHSKADNQYCHIVVEDSGVGIPEDDQVRIFDEFYQVNPDAVGKGLGLGLSIVTRLVSLLDIQLKLHSAVGAGTSFTLTLPASQDAIARSDGSTGEMLLLTNLSFLVVDNEESIRAGMRSLLESHGATVHTASSREEAVKCIEDGPVSLLITDLGLGEENGLDVRDHLSQQLGLPLPTILLTGDTGSFEFDRENLKLLHKPVDPDLLLSAIRDQVKPG